MDYYAKSKEKELTDLEKRKIERCLEGLLTDLDDKLQEWEKKALRKAQENLFKRKEKQPKTVKGHLDDTVRCAEAFFRQYGQYFSGKEKTLVLSACGYHDLGKVNLLFQEMVNPGLKRTCIGKTGRERQIPHGYLSAVSIRKREYLLEHPEITENDFYVMITAIYFHHTREDCFESDQIRAYCEKYYCDELCDYLGKDKWKPKWKPSTLNQSHLLFRNKETEENSVVSEQEWNQYLGQRSAE